MLFKFYIKKAFREQKKAIIVLPIATIFMVVFVILMITYIPSTLTGFTTNMLQSSLDEIGRDKNGSMLIAALMSQGTFFAAMFCGAIGSNMSSGIVDIEVRSGALETVLSAGNTFSQVLGTMFLVSLTLGLITATVLIIVMSAFILMGINYYGFSTSIFPAQIFVVPYVCLLSGLTGGFMIQTLLPRMAKIKAGSTANMGQLASLVPLIFLLVITIGFHDVNIWVKVAYFTIILVGISIVFMALTIKRVSLAQTLER